MQRICSGASRWSAQRTFTKPAKAGLKWCMVAFSVLGLTACSSVFEPYLEITDLPASGVMSAAPSLSAIIVQDPKRMKRVCMAPGADAVVQQSDSADFSLSLVSTGKSDSDKSAVQDNVGEQEMSGRTPAVLLAREIFYRTCELSNNFALNKDEAMDVFKSSLETVEKAWLVEAQNTKVTIGDSLEIKNSDNISSTETSSTQTSSASSATSSTSGETESMSSDSGSTSSE